MAEYIDRQEAINRLFEAIPYHVALQTGLERAINYLRAIPAADVRHAVYCKDCRNDCHCLIQDFMEDCGITHDDQNNFFCGYGKKREES